MSIERKTLALEVPFLPSALQTNKQTNKQCLFKVTSKFKPCCQLTFMNAFPKLCFNVITLVSGTNTKTVHADLVIRGFATRGFDYSRTRKQGKTANNEGKNTI